MKNITTTDLHKIKESLLESMKINFKNNGKLFPVVFIIAPDGEMTVIGTPYTSQEEKNLMMGMVRSKCKEVDAIAVCIVNEAWIRKVTPEEYKKFQEEFAKTGKRISGYDDKKEVALMMIETKLTGETIAFDIDRSNNELINKISARTEGGDFSHILSPIINKN